MSSPGGLRKRRTTYFVQVPSTTIRDSRLSYKARGLLAYLLDMPDGWDVRSEYLADQGEEVEGVYAVRSALKELAKHGYYRLERRRLLSGQFTMGTAVSEESVPEWIADSTEYDDRAVPCVEQSNGTFRVKHKDGSLSDDGFETPVDNPGEDHSGAVTGVRFSDPGSPEVGQPAPLSSNEEEDSRSSTDDSLRSSSVAVVQILTDDELTTGRDTQGAILKGKKATTLAQRICKEWWDWMTDNELDKPGVSFIACQKIIQTTLRNGRAPKDVKHGLAVLTEQGAPISGNTLHVAITNWRPGQQKMNWQKIFATSAALDQSYGIDNPKELESKW